MGIAIDVKEHNDNRDHTLHKKAEDSDTISIDDDLIALYRKYETTHNSQNAMDTFVVYTREFHDELKQTERHLFSREINFDDKTFFLGDLSVMQDTEGIISNNKINIVKFRQMESSVLIRQIIGASCERTGWG
jgi:hypothetical protein